ncbi:MAG: glycosyltransferase family 4 protein [Patescibacteria group bacterium]
MKHTLLVTLDFPPTKGGVSHMLWQHCSQLPAGSVSVLTQDAAVPPSAPFPVFRRQLLSRNPLLPSWILLSVVVVSMLRHLRKTTPVDHILVGQVFPVGTAVLLAAGLFGIPYSVYVNGLDILVNRGRSLKMRFLRTMLRRAAAVFTCSAYSAALAISFGSAVDRTHVVYPCPDSSLHREVDDVRIQKFRHRYRLGGKKVILSVGNLVRRKGFDLVLNSLPVIQSNIANTVYVIVGIGPDWNYLHSLATGHGLNESVIFAGQVGTDELADWYRSSDVFAMPSREILNANGQAIDVEGFGMVFLEANLYGKPTIGGRSGGVPEAVVDGTTGLLVDPNSVESFTKAAVKLLSDSQLASQLGEQGRRRVLADFSVSKQIEPIRRTLS